MILLPGRFGEEAAGSFEKKDQTLIEKTQSASSLYIPILDECTAKGCKRKPTSAKKVADFWIQVCAECNNKGFSIDMDKVSPHRQIKDFTPAHFIEERSKERFLAKRRKSEAEARPCG